MYTCMVYVCVCVCVSDAGWLCWQRSRLQARLTAQTRRHSRQQTQHEPTPLRRHGNRLSSASLSTLSEERLVSFSISLLAYIGLRITRLTSPYLIWTPLRCALRCHCVYTVYHIGTERAVIENWIASQRTTQYAVAVTNHSTLSSDKICSIYTLWQCDIGLHLRWGGVKWDEWYEHSFRHLCVYLPTT